MENTKIDSAEVSAVNMKFYDSIADVYNKIDSRRKHGEEKHVWIDPVLDQICTHIKSFKQGEPSVFLDAGSGSGFLSKRAHTRFDKTILLDISQKMLERIEIEDSLKIKGDCNHIPLKDSSIDFVGAFATLHHLFSPDEFFAESYRILKPGGVLYTDHDIEAEFIQNHRILLGLYRSIFDHGAGYLKSAKNLTEKDYKITEYHGDSGLDGALLASKLEALGFELLEVKYHWEGMGAVASLLAMFGIIKWRQGKGKAPVTRIIARKK